MARVESESGIGESGDTNRLWLSGQSEGGNLRILMSGTGWETGGGTYEYFASGSGGYSFAAQQNCMPSAQINCHTTWKEEEGFLLPSRLLCTKSEFPYLIAKRCNAILANSESLSGLAQRPTLAQCSSGRLCGPSVRRGPNEFQRLWSA